MRIIYFTSRRNTKNPYGSSERLYDLDATSNTITKIILDNIGTVEQVVFAGEVYKSDIDFSDVIAQFDLCLCDLTTHNANHTYLAGLAEGLGKPVIYFCTNEHPITTIFESKSVMQYSEASLEHEFKAKLINLIQNFIDDPSSLSLESKQYNKQPKAFISYSHKDRHYLDRLMIHLKPLERKGVLDVWQDTQIKVGDKWQEKINSSLNEANIAILLLSADFMASDFIVENELPPILSNAEVNGTKIIPVILSHCRFAREPSLNRFQAANLPSEPLSSMTLEEREAVYDKLTSEIESALNNT